MKENLEKNKTLSFVNRWIMAFTRIFKVFGERDISDNAEFVDAILKDDLTSASSQEDIDMVVEKRKLLIDLCDDVDTYYEKKSSADKAEDFDQWFDNEIRTFVNDTIPNANQEDVKEIEDTISDLMEKEIGMRTKLLESEFEGDESDYKKYSPANDSEDE